MSTHRNSLFAPFHLKQWGEAIPTEAVLWQTLSGMRLLTFCAISPFLSPFFPQEYVAYSHTGRIIPAIWFRYDLSPITVKYTERRQPLYRFITSVSEPKLSSPLPLPAPRVSPEPFLSRGIEFVLWGRYSSTSLGRCWSAQKIWGFLIFNFVFPGRNFPKKWEFQHSLSVLLGPFCAPCSRLGQHRNSGIEVVALTA